MKDGRFFPPSQPTAWASEVVHQVINPERRKTSRSMAFRVTGRVLGALQRERNDVQLALKKTWKAYQHTDGLVSIVAGPSMG